MIKIKSTNFDLTDGIREAVFDKLQKFEKYDLHDKRLDVTLYATKKEHKVKILAKIHNKVLKAEAVDSDLYTALDLATDILNKRIRRYKSKIQIKDRDSIRKEAVDPEDLEEGIIRRKVVSRKPMSEDEAILQMTMLGHKSFLFFDSNINEVAMLYERRDGNYGILTLD